MNTSNPCKLDSDVGGCRGYFPMFYFDSETKSCESFIYGGCGGLYSCGFFFF